MQDISRSSYLDTTDSSQKETFFTLAETCQSLIEVDGTSTVFVDGDPTTDEWLAAKTAVEKQTNLGTAAKETA